MRVKHLSFRVLGFGLAAFVALCSMNSANADPPSRVARLSHMTGAVSFSPAGENDWVVATVNRPLSTGDRLWADAGARAEVEVGGAVIRMDAATGLSILNLDDRIAQLQLTQGTLNVRVLRLASNQSFEVDTPNLAFTLRQPGSYRIEVEPDGLATTIVVRKGQGDVYGEGAAYVVDSRQPYRFTGTGLREYAYVDPPRPDDFDRWSGDRDRHYDNSISARYVSPDVVGYQELDANGTWRVDASYGNVWTPSRVTAGWAPYHDGHWAWVDPWGWTWVDDAPWGFAVSHYGRWVNLRGSWAWVPGPVRSRAYYAPALVAFVGGAGFQLAISGGNVGGIAWFPLGPREVYRPAYPVSRGYFQNVNNSNTIISTTVINNYYTNTNVTNVVYANRTVPGALVAVPAAAFVGSQPVSRAAVGIPREMIASGHVGFIPPIAPTAKSVQGAAAPGGKPPSRVFERPVVARTAPPAARAGFAVQQEQLAARPGRPLDDAARTQLKPAIAPSSAIVNVIPKAPAVPPTLRPPAASRETKADETRARSDRPSPPSPTAVPPSTPGAPAPRNVLPPAAPAGPEALAPQRPDRSGARNPAEPRGQPAASPLLRCRARRPLPPPLQAQPVRHLPLRVRPCRAAAPSRAPTGNQPKRRSASPPASPPRPVPAKSAVPPAVSPPPASTAPDSRARPDQRENAGQREKAAEPPPPQRAAAPKAPSPQTAPAAPQSPPPRSEQTRAAQPKATQPPPAPAPDPAARQPVQGVRPESRPAAKQTAPTPAVTAPEPAPRQSRPATRPAPPEQKPAAAVDDASDRKKGSDEPKRDQDERKPKN